MNKTCNRIKVTEAADILGVDRKTILLWIDKKILRAYSAGVGCMWLIDKDDLDKVLVPSIPLDTEGASNNERNPSQSR